MTIEPTGSPPWQQPRGNWALWITEYLQRTEAVRVALAEDVEAAEHELRCYRNTHPPVHALGIGAIQEAVDKLQAQRSGLDPESDDTQSVDAQIEALTALRGELSK